jgi:hypothetical protein
MITASRSAFITILEFGGRPAYPIPTECVHEAEDFAVQAALDFPDLVSASVYRCAGPTEEYSLLQTLKRKASV